MKESGCFRNLDAVIEYFYFEWASSNPEVSASVRHISDATPRTFKLILNKIYGTLTVQSTQPQLIPATCFIYSFDHRQVQNIPVKKEKFYS
jgi:hypothetical protein